ncbi:Uncharacterized protein Rs2_42409 [Raphanus sativus]|nr:Uncharacterized protein Rs2_42409 [Raphanus sativus]
MASPCVHVIEEGWANADTRIVVSRISVLGSYECEKYVITVDPQIIEFLFTAKVNEIHADKGWCYGCPRVFKETAVLVAFDEEMATITNIQASKAVYIVGGADVPQAKLPGVETQGSAVDCNVSAVSTKQQLDPEENGPKKAAPPQNELMKLLALASSQFLFSIFPISTHTIQQCARQKCHQIKFKAKNIIVYKTIDMVTCL